MKKLLKKKVSTKKPLRSLFHGSKENDQAETHEPGYMYSEDSLSSSTSGHKEPILAGPAGYAHLPLDTANKEIRILRIDNIAAVASNEPIQCSVEHISLSTTEDPDYHAISYCWGDSPVNRSIFLNGTAVNVPQSAIVALRGILRCRRDVSRVWIDAICINQDNPTEKVQQIAIMGDVYSKAQSVLVWFGEDNGSTAAAMRILDLIIRNLSFLHKQGDDALYPVPETEKRHARMLLNDSKVFSVVVDWSPLWAFFEAPWFSRVWVMQEIALARRAVCYCGKFEIPWNFIIAAVSSLGAISHIDTAWFMSTSPNMGDRAAELAGALGWTNTMILSKVTNKDYIHREPYEWLIAAAPRNVTKPHDKVYGTLGLMKLTYPAIFKSILPDYDEPLKKVYGEVAWLCMSSSKSLHLLVWAHCTGENEILRDRKFQDFPSWIPTFHFTAYSGTSGSVEAVFVSNADAGVTPRISRHTSNSDLLYVRGVSVDRLVNSQVIFGGVLDVSGSVEKLLACFKDFIVHLVVTREIPGPRTKDVACLLVQGLYGGSDVEDATNLVPDFCHFILQAVLEELSRPENRLTGLPEPILMEILNSLTAEATRDSKGVEHFTRTLSAHIQSQAYFKTYGDLIGVGPATLKKDDYLCILYGARLPFITRKMGANWKIIGCCYARSIQKGEFVRDLIERDQLDATSQTFTIC